MRHDPADAACAALLPVFSSVECERARENQPVVPSVFNPAVDWLAARFSADLERAG